MSYDCAKKKVFVLGDSRTGTMTLHRFLSLAGYRSIHYFFEESGVSKPAHAEYERNWKNLWKFIESSGFDAFSDYPLRTFYKDLIATFPDAYFILSVRKDVETWQRSMNGFFSKFGIQLDIKSLTQSYLRINHEIRELTAEKGSRFCEICIDADAEDNGAVLSEFLGLEDRLSLGHENRTAAYDTALWSSRVSLYSTGSEDFLDYVKRLTRDTKAMLSEYGWVYLINDSSKFLDFCYGDLGWTEDNITRCREVLETRRATLEARGTSYLKFAIPEKSIVYPQFLPKIFRDKPISADRPAIHIEALGLNFFTYLHSVLDDASSYGILYFRGDSHANWLGAYFVYHAIVSKLNSSLKNDHPIMERREPHRLSEMKVAIASYGGDLFGQLEREARSHFGGPWQDVSLGDKIEYLVQYTLKDQCRKAHPIPVEVEYLERLGERETFRFTNSNKALPKAVIFRDSTADYLVDLLAEHFSESLFIWHKGVVYDDVIARENPDVVLHIMAERFLSQYEINTAFSTLGLFE